MTYEDTPLTKDETVGHSDEDEESGLSFAPPKSSLLSRIGVVRGLILLILYTIAILLLQRWFLLPSTKLSVLSAGRDINDLVPECKYHD